MPVNLDNLFGIHEAALRLRDQRTELLSANLANADTPGYKARDIDFQSALADSQGMQGLVTTNSLHMTGGGEVGGGPELLYRVPSQPSVDGNTVDTQREKAEFMENSLYYQASLRFIDGSIRSLRTAIKGT